MELIQNIDDSILMFIQNNICNPTLDKLMPIVTSIGNGGLVWIVVAMVLLLIKKYRKYGVIMFIALLLCLIIGNVCIKTLVARPRPCHINTTIKLLIGIPLDYSFPSGHTMCAFAATAVLWYMNKKIGIISSILAIAIAFSRMYLYVHYPSDIFCGALIGLLISIFSIKSFICLQRKFPGKIIP